MRITTRLSSWLLVMPVTMGVLVMASAVHAQVTGQTDVNLSRKGGADSECAIAKNPANRLQLFALCNTGGPGLFASRSTDGGVTWTFPDPADKTIADGDAGQGPTACCDPNLAWDSFGNLFLTYLDSAVTRVVTILSTDGGSTFANLVSFGPASVDQPSVVTANTTAPGAPVAVWVVWNQAGQMVARGAPVTGLGTAGVGAFTALQTIPGTVNCSFGDIAIAPSGAVVQACGSPTGGQGPSTIFVNTDADGLGPGNFAAAVAATTTNVGGFDFIPAQNARSVDPEAGLAFDSNPSSPHAGRLYLVYTDETVAENNDTDIFLRFSDNSGTTWSARQRVNDDAATPIRSQFLPKIAVNTLTGDIVICWHDARNSATNTAVQEFCTWATPAGATPSFLANARIADGSSTSNGIGIEFGDYSGLAFFQDVAHPIWADASNSTSNNPNGTSNFDAYTDRVTNRPRIITSICFIHPELCDVVVMKPGIAVLNCKELPCIIRDPIPRNCLVKFPCPGCLPGALCPPFYTFVIDGLDPAWRVELYDPRGQVVAYQRRRTPSGTIISFRPSREYFKGGKIGEYFFTFETTDRAQLGRDLPVRMSVRAGSQPFGSLPREP